MNRPGEKLQEKIRELEIYKEIFLNSSDPIEIFDPNGFYLEQNPAFWNLTGYSENELQGKTPAIHLGKKVFSRILKALSQKVKYQGTLTSQPKAGYRRHLELSAFPIRDQKGEVAGYIAISRDITERRRAKEALRETNENYRSLVENIDLIIARMDSDYNIIMGNSALEKALNKPFAEIVGKKCYQEFEKRDSICDRCPGRKAMATKVTQAVETERFRDNGTRFQVYNRAFPTFDLDGTPNGFIEVGEDITVRRQAEKELRLERDNLKRILDSMEDGVYISNFKKEIEYANPAIIREFGNPDGKKCYHYFNELESTCPGCGEEETCQGARKEWYSSKNRKTYELVFTPIKKPDGSTSKMTIFRDITERKKNDGKLQNLSRELAESQILLSNVLEYSTEFSIAATDLDFRIILYNKKAEEMYGYTAQEVMGRTLKEIHTKEKVSKLHFLRAIKTVLQEGKYEYHITQKSAGGNERTYQSVVFPMRDRPKKHCGYVVFSHDVTEQKQAEEELKQRDTYLSMIAQIGQRLLSAPGEGWKYFTPVLKILGKTAGADRVYIFKNHRDREGDLLCSQLYEWADPKIEAQITNLQNFSYRKGNFSRWVKIMSNQGIISGPVSSFPESERKLLQEQGIQSLLAVPIFIDHEWWGLLGLDSCRSERKWNKVEETLLQTVATTLGGFFKRLEEEKRISQSLREKEVLLREIHHRVKNNLQIVSSLLHLQAGQIKDQPYKQMFLSSQNRVKTMSLIHQKLCQASDLSSINIGSFIKDLAKNLFRVYQEKSQNILLEVSAEELDFGVDLAIPSGLIITELVSNSLKYAFPENGKGKIKINLSKTEEGYFISVSDNGVGFPEGLDPLNTQTLGLQLVVSLVESQLNGQIELVRGQGSTFNITAK